MAATLALRTSALALVRAIPATAAKIQYAIHRANASRPDRPTIVGAWTGPRSRAPSAGGRRWTSSRSSASAQTLLHEEIARLVLELEGPGLDEEVFARLSPGDVELVRGSLQGRPAAEGDEDEWFELHNEDPETDREELEAEIVRLQAEIAASTRRQEAFQRYLDALDE